MTRHRWSVVAVALLALLLAGCGGGGDGEAVRTDAVEIRDFAFGPKTIRVKAGTPVRFTNRDSAVHTATADDGAFDTGIIEQGQTKTVRLDRPGTFSYFCEPHPYMKGTVVVEE